MTYSPAVKQAKGKRRNLLTSLSIRSIFLSLFFILLPGTAFANTTYTITGNATGGDCELIGNWNEDTDTCRLTQDVFGRIILNSEGLTLDGDGHTLTGESGNGVTFSLSSASHSTITDIIIENFTTGIHFGDVKNVTVTHSTLRNNSRGMLMNLPWPGGAAHHRIENNKFLDNTTHITGSRTNNNIIQHNTIRGGGSGILFMFSEDTVIANNILEDILFRGISFDNSARVTLLNNSVSGASSDEGEGLRLLRGEDHTVKNNTIDSWEDGLVIEPIGFSLSENVVTNSSRGIRIDLSSSFPNNMIDTTNTVNGYPIYYFEDIQDEVIDEEKEVAIFVCVRCNNVTVKNITARNGHDNFMFYRFNNSVVENVVSEGGLRGFDVNMSLINTFIGNTIKDVYSTGRFDRDRVGMRFRSSSHNIITENTFLNNPFHLSFSNPQHDKVFRNNFHGAGKIDGGSTSRIVSFQQPLPLGGNYWEQNTFCTDENGDGICDEPYNVDGSKQDNYPWASPSAWESYTEATATPELSFPETAPEGITTETGVSNRGIADETEFTFSVLYTHEDGEMPDSVELHIADDALSVGNTTATSSVYTLTPTSGDPETGILYTTTLTFPKNHYRFRIHAEVDGETIYIPNEPHSTFGSDIRVAGNSFRTGYSNVAFVPGVKGSRLFTGGWFSSTENQLWEPNINADVTKLILNTDATSSDPDIFTKTHTNGVVDTALKWKDIYASFIDFMDALESSGTIHSWRALPYDWRLAFDDVLTNGSVVGDRVYYDASHGENTYHIYKNLEQLADSSDTGKVTLLAHSMGGLLVKKLLADLEDDLTHPYHHLLERVDTVIMVATPQLGTPQAVGALLYGTKEGIPEAFPLAASRRTSRLIAQNMPSAYNLLPSRLYMERVRERHTSGSISWPRIVFWHESFLRVRDPLIDPNDFISRYGAAVATYDDLRDYLEGKEGRGTTSLNILTHPTILRSHLLDQAEALHDRIDRWQAPDLNGDGSADIRVVQIAGWGSDTIRGLEYGGTIFGNFVMRPKFTKDGDNTVVLPSAIAMDTETYFVDLFEHNSRPERNANRYHASVLEVDSLQGLIKNIVEKRETPYSGLKYIHNKEEDLPKEKLPPYLRLALHSPLDLHIRDSQGNHVGIISTTTPEGEEAFFVNEEIPNSYYLEFGEGKYAGIPLDEETYTITLDAYGSGHFTFEIEEVLGDETIRTQTFSNIPVSTTTVASITLTQTTEEAATLSLDTNGDGRVDTTIFSDEYEKEQEESITFTTLKDALNSLDTKRKNTLLNRANNAEKQAGRGNMKPAANILTSLKRDIEKFSRKNAPKQHRIPQDDAQNLIAIIDILIGRLEE